LIIVRIYKVSIASMIITDWTMIINFNQYNLSANK